MFARYSIVDAQDPVAAERGKPGPT
jgi:hypothetical protein